MGFSPTFIQTMAGSPGPVLGCSDQCSHTRQQAWWGELPASSHHFWSAASSCTCQGMVCRGYLLHNPSLPLAFTWAALPPPFSSLPWSLANLMSPQLCLQTQACSRVGWDWKSCKLLPPPPPCSMPRRSSCALEEQAEGRGEQLPQWPRKAGKGWGQWVLFSRGLGKRRW